MKIQNPKMRFSQDKYLYQGNVGGIINLGFLQAKSGIRLSS